MVREIARATVEQVQGGSKQVTDAIHSIAETVQQIASATSEQAKGSEAIIRSAEKMRAITKHVERSSQEQTRGSEADYEIHRVDLGDGVAARTRRSASRRAAATRFCSRWSSCAS